MVRGLMVIDQQKNTIIVPIDSSESGIDLADMMRHHADLSKVHKHETLKDLDKDIRAYINNTYEQEE